MRRPRQITDAPRVVRPVRPAAGLGITPGRTATAGASAAQLGVSVYQGRSRRLWGVSLAALVTALGASEARAQTMGALMAASHQAAAIAAAAGAPSAATGLNAAAMAAASARALRYQGQVNTTLSNAMAAQAQAAAQAAASVLGVVDGLGVGGLQPAVTQITPASADATGLKTWQGADLPTDTTTTSASGVTAHNVNIIQTDPRALLDWTTFNVGQHTTLTFQQTQNGVSQPGWVVLNRVVGQLDPLTGLRDPNLGATPSQILGSIKAPGTVLVINQNGIVFGAGAQVNVGSLLATSLEIGTPPTFNPSSPDGLSARDTEFLNFGLLGYQEQQGSLGQVFTLSPQVQSLNAFGQDVFDGTEGAVQVEAGASLTSAASGYLMLLAPTVVNAGALSASDGEVALQSGREFTITPSSGGAGSPDPNVRGLIVSSNNVGAIADSVQNLADGIIQSPRGYVSLGASAQGSVTDAGVITSTTSVSENGYVNIYAPTIDIAPGAVISIAPDTSTTTIPQDPTSLADFQPSRVRIGAYAPGQTSDNGETLPSTSSAQIDIGAGSLIYAPGANISIGADPNSPSQPATGPAAADQVTIGQDAVIDAAGLTDVLIPASRNSIEISPVLGNELADSPAFRNGFLNGATVFLDPRLSGVTADGVAWVGSPLISAAAYAQQVGVSVSELMVKGGNVTLGAPNAPAGSTLAQAPPVVVDPGAVINIAGGWKTYQAGEVKQSYLVTSTGQLVPISQADPNATYVAVYQGYETSQPRWGTSQSYLDPLLSGSYLASQYTEGQDAGSLTVQGSAFALDGSLFADAYPGSQQILDAAPGTATPSLFGDKRQLQAVSSQLPAGGYLDVYAFGGGGDIDIGNTTSSAPGTTTTLNAADLSAAGLSQLSVATTGAINVTADAALSLAPGGVFEAVAGRAITVDGSITAPDGSIDLTTVDVPGGSVFGSSPPLGIGSFDIDINGQLNVAGRWANDFGANAGQLVGSAYIDGGEITLNAAPRVSLGSTTTTLANAASATTTDISGSILINPGATLNLAGGGYMNTAGALTLAASGVGSGTGGDLTLIDDTTYFQIADATTNQPGGISGFRVSDITALGSPVLPVNPGAITSRVSIADGSILDAGFGGGGTFTLTTPSFSLGGTTSVVPAGQSGTVLPSDFFSNTGFANYNITSYGTDLLPNLFDNNLDGYSAVLATQVVEVKDGQTLSLIQSMFSPLLTTSQVTALQDLDTGSSLYSVLKPAVPTDAWDQKAVNLTLGGLLELHVDAGARVIGAAGGGLTVSQLFNEGLIRIPGGTVTQSETLPQFYGQGSAIGVQSLSEVFGPPDANGRYSESAPNKLGPQSSDGAIAADNNGVTPIYLLADLPAGEGMLLAPGGTTDVSGEAIIDPRAIPQGGLSSANYVDGKVVAGGSLISTDPYASGGGWFHAPAFGSTSVYSLYSSTTLGVADTLVAGSGAAINLAGAQATFDMPTAVSASGAVSYGPTLVWSNGGDLIMNQGGDIAGAAIQAQGGAPLALGGTLSVLDPVLYQSNAPATTLDALSAADIQAAGFSTLVAQGGLTSVGDVTLTLSRGLFVETPSSFLADGLTAQAAAAAESPVIGSGGALVINAPYIGLDGGFQSVSTPAYGAIGQNTLQLNADAIDIVGAVVLDQSIGQATLSTTGDIRLIGAPPSSIGVSGALPTTLAGELVGNGDVTFKSAQLYPTTGTSFTLSSTGVSSPSASNGGTISFVSNGAPALAPYSAGGNLVVQAANIKQDGVVRVPLGSLTLGGDAPLQTSNNVQLAPATTSVTLDSGSTTSVSADGLSIPYGTTTDQVEWYFAPTSSNPLTAPPAGMLHLAGGTISASSGAGVDLSGGGDVYAYEFVPGTGGTRDVLDQFNPDQFSSSNGYQYPDGRQIYAIVPGLSSATVAAYDPIYSSSYSSIYGPSQAGLSVYFNAAPGLTAGWYTLLPAKYALLPGGMRVVQDTTATTPPPTDSTLSDGTIVTSGYFGVAGVNTRGAILDVFDVQSQSVFRTESQIALTSGNTAFAADAALAGTPVPQLPIDAARLILSPVTGLTLDASFNATPADVAATATTPALVGRGSEVDISGANLIIDDAVNPVARQTGDIILSDTTLANLDAASLFLGGARTDNADGTTSLDVSSNTITVADGATLTAPEIILAVDGSKSALTIASGAAIVADGDVTGEASGDYVIDGLAADGGLGAQGGFLRVSNGPDRLLSRLNVNTKVKPGSLVIGAADLQGAAVELNGQGKFTLAKTAKIDASSVALGARSITFGTGNGGLVLTPALQTLLSKATNLTLQSRKAIRFDAGSYGFGDLTLDAPGLTAVKGSVDLKTGVLSISNSGAASAACGASGALACGGNDFSITASSISFGSGTVRTYGAGGGVTLNAAGGVFSDGVGTFNVGAADLVINTPFVGAQAGSTIPSLTLTTTGAVRFASATPASAFAAPAGAPGSDLTIDGSSVTVLGTELRATAGALDIQSATGVAISGGALLATPGYAKVFSDAADPTILSAPGGLLSITALDGDIAISDDSTLSVGGGQGQAGSLSLIAQNGQAYAYHGATTNIVDLASTFSASAPGGGASLTLDTGGGFDLAAFASGAGQQFTGTIAIRSGAGDLTLAAGDILKAASIQIVADGGQLVDAGTIDTSGANGGAVSLYGADGVQLTSSAAIDAHANGNGPASTLQASGGDVTLGTEGAGAIDVAAGATIDLAALNTGARLVNMGRTNGTDYTYVAGDVGGTLTLRAPVISQAGAPDTMNLSVQGAVQGASSVVLEGVRDFDLGALASNPDYVGVGITDGVATLDTGATGAPNTNQINALSDLNGPVVQFVQNFDVSADYGALGGLASQANFHAQPDIELDYAGDIVLKSNWNLGAGVVNVQGAVAAGLMAPDLDLPGQFTVAPGAQGQILAQYATALYRVGGTFYGEPGVLSIRAGGDLNLQGSITDGFFQFADQTDPNYLNQILGGGDRVYQGAIVPTCNADCSAITIAFPGAPKLSFDPYQLPTAPYSAAANTAAALGDAPVAGGALISGTGDPLGGAELFPLLPQAGGGVTPISSWSYQLTAGADLTGSNGGPSVNPLATVAGSGANVTVGGQAVLAQNVYGYRGVKGTVSVADSLELQDVNSGDNLALSPNLDQSPWYLAFKSEHPGLDPNSVSVTITLGSAPTAARPVIAALEKQFFAANPSYPAKFFANGKVVATPAATGKVVTNLVGAAELMADVSSNFSQLAPFYKAPAETGVVPTTTYATSSALIRTGTGNIGVAASGNIDLSNGPPSLLTTKGAVVSSTSSAINASLRGLQLGGAPVYTAGHLAELDTVDATDTVTGAVFTVDLGANAISSDNLSGQGNGYAYGVSGKSGIPGVLIADPVYADGGGDVALDAGVDVHSRRDTLLENELGGVGVAGETASKASWIGSGDQPWRTGTIGDLVNLRIDPQLFAEGVGALGGGDISVDAGRNVSDLSVVSTDSVTTASVGGLDAAGIQPLALVALGGGNVSVTVGDDILGGRLDVAAGDALIKASRDVASAGQITERTAQQSVLVDNTLRMRLSDGDVTIDAGGTVALQGISALGVASSGADSSGFYSAGSGVSIFAVGDVSIANTGTEVLEKAIGADATVSAVYPGSLTTVSFTGNIGLSNAAAGAGPQVLLYPDATGTLDLLAAGDISPAVIAQLDSDPTLLPGAFTSYAVDPLGSNVLSGLAFDFPTVEPNTSDVVLRELHNESITHAGDTTPNRIVAGGDIQNMILSTAKQTRVAAGRDIVNMMFFGQNVSPDDITRITAGRDITATTTLLAPYVSQGGSSVGQSSSELPAVQGNTFVLGGPGALFVEAGRNAGPFLNSAVTDGFTNANGASLGPSGQLTYGGGILSVGNLWNPWLGTQGADVLTEFGVAPGQNFNGLISTYLAPSNFANLPGYLFEQTTDASGAMTPDRTQEIYALSLVDWMKSIASSVIDHYDTTLGVSAPPANASNLIQFMESLQAGATPTVTQALAYLPQLSNQTMPLIPWVQLHESAALLQAYGTQDVTYAQALATFQSLPALNQREFLLKDVYFNELTQTSVPTSPSYLIYSRGYDAVNTLFPAADGYSANFLAGVGDEYDPTTGAFIKRVVTPIPGPFVSYVKDSNTGKVIGGVIRDPTSGQLVDLMSYSVTTGSLDLRLATIQTEEGGDIGLLGPGGRVLAGSTVSTSVQASRRVYAGGALFAGNSPFSPLPALITQIPPGYEGVLTLRGGAIDSFTDGDFLLNQSRAFTEEGGYLAIWSSNGDVNAGQGPRTTADVPPIVVNIDEDGYSQISTTSAVSGAGIGAFAPDGNGLAPDVFLIAPSGTVDAGAAGVRSAGNVFVAAFQVANAVGIQATGTISGAGGPAVVNVAAQTSGDAASAAAAHAAQAAASSDDQPQRPLIIVDPVGALADDSDVCSVEDVRRGVCK